MLKNTTLLHQHYVDSTIGINRWKSGMPIAHCIVCLRDRHSTGLLRVGDMCMDGR